jgi:hypothetical protein
MAEDGPETDPRPRGNDTVLDEDDFGRTDA